MARKLIRQGMKPHEAALRCGFQDYAGFLPGVQNAYRRIAGAVPKDGGEINRFPDFDRSKQDDFVKARIAGLFDLGHTFFIYMR